MDSTIAQWIDDITTWLDGRTDRHEEASILSIFGKADANQLNELLETLDVSHLFRAVDDHLTGEKNRTRLYTLLIVDRLAELRVNARVALVNAWQQGQTGRQAEQAIRDIFLGTHGSTLTALKNAIDAGPDYRDLQQLLFTDIDDVGIRCTICAHIAKEGKTNALAAIKVLSDIDDTFYPNFRDPRYPRRTTPTYPGVIQYYTELMRGPNADLSHLGHLAFLTARPTVRSGSIEAYTKNALRQKGITTDFTVLSGGFGHLVGNASIAAKKYDNFVQYQELFPEYGFVFIGDSGQGDALFGERIWAAFPGGVRGIFIHDVLGTSVEERDHWRSKGVIFFDTYVGAAVEAFKVGLIGQAGVQRIIAAAERELAAIAFTDTPQQHAREVDLTRDIEAAGMLA